MTVKKQASAPARLIMNNKELKIIVGAATCRPKRCYPEATAARDSAEAMLGAAWQFGSALLRSE